MGPQPASCKAEPSIKSGMWDYKSLSWAVWFGLEWRDETGKARQPIIAHIQFEASPHFPTPHNFAASRFLLTLEMRWHSSLVAERHCCGEFFGHPPGHCIQKAGHKKNSIMLQLYETRPESRQFKTYFHLVWIVLSSSENDANLLDACRIRYKKRSRWPHPIIEDYRYSLQSY